MQQIELFVGQVDALSGALDPATGNIQLQIGQRQDVGQLLLATAPWVRTRASSSAKEKGLTR